MLWARIAMLVATFMLAISLTAGAQNRRDFYDGVRDGGRGGQYDRGHDHDRNRNQGGIGPGKGALIGAGGGAVLGALLGGGLKGTIIGGAAGAGVGAVLGQAHQDNERDDRHYRR